MFWLMPLFFFAMVMRRRCGATMGPGSNPMHGGWPHERYGPPPDAGEPVASADLEQQQSYIDGLESRVSELEERLDFTERMLVKRNDAQGS
jgi:hypothetical protein